MGTRGILGFISEGNIAITYNHFDSYPGGLGVDVAKWLSTADRVQAAQLAAQLRPVDSNEEPSEEDRVKYAHLWDKSVGAGRDWYAVLRNAQGEPDAILSTGVYEDALGFAGDSLFCEWGYIVNFDDGVLEFYKGFQTKPGEGRFQSQFPNGREPWTGAPEKYYPITLVASIPFDEVSTKYFIDYENDDEDENDE